MGKTNLKQLIEDLNFECLSGEVLLDRIPQSAYVSDLLSDVMGKARADMMWVTSQVHKNIVAVASLKELSAIVIVNERPVEKELLEQAENEEVVILSSNAFLEFEDQLFKYEFKNNVVERYHRVLLSNKNATISKYQSMKLVPASKASNSYESDTQATYKANKDVYFITYNNQTFEFDGKQKSLEKIISGKADAIKAFYKENKIKENDSDMIKLGNFLATL